MIDLRHPLAVLATRMPWSEIEASLAPLFAHRARAGRHEVDCDLFGPSTQLVGGGVRKAGRPRLPIRLMVALLYLKHAYNESDESVVQRRAQDVYFQFFSGMAYFVGPEEPLQPAWKAALRAIADGGDCRIGAQWISIPCKLNRGSDGSEAGG